MATSAETRPDVVCAHQALKAKRIGGRGIRVTSGAFSNVNAKSNSRPWSRELVVTTYIRSDGAPFDREPTLQLYRALSLLVTRTISHGYLYTLIHLAITQPSSKNHPFISSLFNSNILICKTFFRSLKFKVF